MLLRKGKYSFERSKDLELLSSILVSGRTSSIFFLSDNLGDALLLLLF
jgi:hypothetical protein